MMCNTSGAGFCSHAPRCAAVEEHKGSKVAEFFTFLLVLGLIVAAFGVWWSRFASGPLLQVLTARTRKRDALLLVESRARMSWS